MTLLDRAARDFAEKFKRIVISGDPPGYREAILPIIAGQNGYHSMSMNDTRQLLSLRASLLVKVSDAVDIMGPMALDPELANAIIDHFMPTGTSIASHCPYCLESRGADHHECPLLQPGGH